MARRKRNTTPKGKGARRAEAGVRQEQGITLERGEEVLASCPEENTSESASTEDTPEDPPIVHHKKFGEIRVQHDEVSLPQSVLSVGNIRVPVIVNGSLPQSNVASTDQKPVSNLESSNAFDGSVIIQPGAFKDLCSPPYSLVHSKDTTEFSEVIQGIRDLKTRLQPELGVPMPMESETMLPSEEAHVTIPLPIGLPLVTIKEEAASSPMLEMSPLENDDVSGSPKKEGSCGEATEENLPSVEEVSTIRRSNRIRSIGILKQKERTLSISPDPEKPVKVKSRWRRSSELEMHSGIGPSLLPPPQPREPESQDQLQERLAREQRDLQEGLRTFVSISENEYKTPRNACKEAKRMTCDCVMGREEVEKGQLGCGDDCLNRMLFIECGDGCALGDLCSNKCFQKRNNSACTIFKTEKKGFGLKAVNAIPSNTFIMEYVGEVVDQDGFSKRVKSYAKDDVKHFYFMSLKGDTIIDATSRGNISRFINHSCDPNAETQKWTVNGELRIGFFSKKAIRDSEEITFDYRFQRYGKEAQKCYCEAANCRGWIGENPDEDDDDEEEEEDEEDEEDDSSEEASDEEKEVGKEAKKDADAKLDEEVELEREKENSDMELDSAEEEEKPAEEPKPPARRGRKPKTTAEKKEKKKNRSPGKRKKDIPVVEDLGLEEEIERLTITGVKNRAHTLMLSRLMVRAEDWPVRSRLLELIATGNEPCRRLFIDYHGLRFLHAWMQSTVHDPTNRWHRRLEILKTLQTLPIPNKTMLIDSKVLSMVEEWAGVSKASDVLSPGTDSAGSSNQTEQPPFSQSSDSVSPLPDASAAAAANDLSDISVQQEAKTLVASLLSSWSALKEVFKIPKKERMEQMKEHEREADRGYRQSVMSRENLDQLYSRYKLDRRDTRDRERDRDRDRGKDGDRARGRDSPSSSDPDWLRGHRDRGRMTKMERRQLFALKVLREEEAARQRMQQEELWSQHKARCTALGLDPNQHPAMDPISGCPIFFDRTTRTWSQTPSYQNYQYAGSYPATYPTLAPPAPPPPNALPYPMMSYMSTASPYPTPSPSIHMTPVYPGSMPLPIPMPRYPVPHNVITLTPDPPLPELVAPLPSVAQQPPPQPERSPDAPALTVNPVSNSMKLPPQWKTAKDSRGFIYYYHARQRVSQWEPPSWTEDQALAEAQRILAAEEEDSSSESSETESEDGDEIEVEAKVEIVTEDPATPETEEKDEEMETDVAGVADTTQPEEDSAGETAVDEGSEAEAEETVTASPAEQPSQSHALDDEDDGDDDEEEIEAEATEEVAVGAEADPQLLSPPASDVPAERPAPKPTKRREGLVQEHIISPRYDSSRADFKKYKETKLKLKRRKERAAEKSKLKSEKLKLKAIRKEKKKREKRVTSAAAESSTDKRIKENFKLSIAGAIVSHLNPFRKQDCKIGRITNNEDFKHLARKLTHFVMVKELKHCQSVDDLQCNESVKFKAKDFVKKYMSKFGPEYERLE